MSEVKIFQIIGTYYKNHKEYLFRKEIRALKEKDALEKLRLIREVLKSPSL